MSVEQIAQNMRELMNKNGFAETKNLEKIAKAKDMMFGEQQWHRCPCDGNNEKRFCISELCKSDIMSTGECHCHCYKLPEQQPEQEQEQEQEQE